MLLLAFTTVVQVLFLRYLPAGLYVDLSLVLVLYLSWHSPPHRGAFLGMVFGLTQDAVLGTYLGINGLVKTLFGFLGAYLDRWIPLEQSAIRPFVLTFLALLDNIFLGGMLLLLRLGPESNFWLEAGIEAAATGIIGAIVFKTYNRLKFPPKDFRRLD